MEVAIIKKIEEGIDKKIKEYKKRPILEKDEIKNVFREVIQVIKPKIISFNPSI